MSLPATGLALIDPLTLLGREVLELIPRFPALRARMVYVHTEPSEEVQIAELDGEPGLVNPLVDPEQLSGCGAVIVASAADRDSLCHLEDWLEGFPERPAVDLSRLDRFRSRCRPVIGGPARTDDGLAHVRIASPALVAVRTVLQAIGHLDPIGVTLAAVDPASDVEDEGIEGLARQAVQRLQGQDVSELVGGHVLAFNQVAADAGDLIEDMAALIPGQSVAASRSYGGCFHGHLAHLSVFFPAPVDHAELLECLEGKPRIAICDLPQRLDEVVGTEQIALAQPHLSPDGRLAVLTAMLDGLRLGGALSALEALESLV